MTSDIKPNFDSIYINSSELIETISSSSIGDNAKIEIRKLIGEKYSFQFEKESLLHERVKTDTLSLSGLVIEDLKKSRDRDSYLSLNSKTGGQIANSILRKELSSYSLVSLSAPSSTSSCTEKISQSSSEACDEDIDNAYDQPSSSHFRSVASQQKEKKRKQKRESKHFLN